MKRQPLLMWRKATTIRAPNVIEDLDEFDRNMGCVKFDASIYSSGVMFMHNRYSCPEMGEIVGLFERKNIPKGDISPKQPRRNQDPHLKVSGKAKIKYDPDDIGGMQLWIPFEDYKRWVPLKCNNPDMQGMPVWLHEQCIKLANIEADEFCSREDQSVFRATLFEMIANVNEKASIKLRKLLGRALADKGTAKSLRRHVEMASEHAEPVEADEREDVHPFAPDKSVIGNALAGGNRKDAMETTPRSRRTKQETPRTWAQMQRDRKRGTPIRMRGDGESRTSKPLRDTSPRRPSGRGLTWKGTS